MEEKDANGNTALHRAAKVGFELAKECLKTPIIEHVYPTSINCIVVPIIIHNIICKYIHIWVGYTALISPCTGLPTLQVYTKFRKFKIKNVMFLIVIIRYTYRGANKDVSTQ